MELRRSANRSLGHRARNALGASATTSRPRVHWSATPGRSTSTALCRELHPLIDIQAVDMDTCTRAKRHTIGVLLARSLRQVIGISEGTSGERFWHLPVFFETRKLIQAFQAEMLKELGCGTVEERTPYGIGTTHAVNEPRVEQGAQHAV